MMMPMSMVTMSTEVEDVNPDVELVRRDRRSTEPSALIQVKTMRKILPFLIFICLIVDE